MSGSTSTVWSFPLTLRVNFWAMSACPPGDGAGLPAGWNPGADARTRGLRPAGTLIQAAVDWNGCNDEILDEILGADRPRLTVAAKRRRHVLAETFRRRRRCTAMRREVRLAPGRSP